MAKLYTVSEMAEMHGLPKSALYQEIRAGRLRAKLRRGTKRPYLLTEEIFDEWQQRELMDATERTAI